jgi:cell division protein ZapA (FtsZ GTPase activity inhibitor)
MNATVRVHLLGRDYMLRSQGDPEHVQEAAALIEERLAGLTDSVSVDTRDRFMLGMLNLAGEYLQEKRRCQALETELKVQQDGQLTADNELKRAESGLIERIENALND